MSHDAGTPTSPGTTTRVERLAASPRRHPRALAPGNLILTVVLSLFGAVVGMQLLATLGIGGGAYLVIALLLTLGTGIATHMSPGMLIGFIVYATAAAFVHELLVGIAAMHAGWFPAFAVALITVLLGILVGFPPEALVVLAGFTAATGPALADMGYDLKTGHLLRSGDADPAFDLEGRRQQLIAAMIGFGVAVVVVLVSYRISSTTGRCRPSTRPTSPRSRPVPPWRPRAISPCGRFPAPWSSSWAGRADSSASCWPPVC